MIGENIASAERVALLGEPQDGRLNCITENCCGLAKAIAALADHLVEYAGLSREAAEAASRCMKRDFDLAPPHTLGPLFKAVGKLAREGFVEAKA